jgi:NADP-dependent 3-hydroxy acid dehydrogenase YdfG
VATNAAPPTDLAATLLAIVAEKTGYPAEMVDTGMDLEADLGIDSIKRVEILSAMRARVPNLPQVNIAKMGAMRTLAQIVSLYQDDEVAAPGAEPPPTAKAPSTSPVAATVARAVVRAVAAPAVGFGAPGLYAGRIAVSPGGGALAARVVERLRARGVDAVAADAPSDDVAGVIFLGGLDARTADEALRVNREAFATARSVAASFRVRGGLFVTVQDTGGDFGLSGRHDARAWLAGLAALARTAAREWPDAIARTIDLERGERTDAQIADALVAELLAGGPEPEVGIRADGERLTLETVPAALEGSGQPVERDAVFVVTGGARGVTAASIVALARQAQPRFVLLGRTPLEDEPAAFRGANDEAALKRVALSEARVEGRTVTPREVGARVEQILAAREVRATLAALAAAGSEARYAPVDVRDPRSLATLLDDVRRTWGPIEGLVHGAGVLADALLEQKTDAQFSRVFDTKVLGLYALLDAMQGDPLRWLCVFSSVAARAGNAGQSDYAMANEVLNKVAALEARRRGPACRVVSIGWGPWDGGMVTPSLREHFTARGVALLGVEAGAQAFVRELGASVRDGVEIVIGGSARGLRLTEATTSRAEVHVSAATHPQLASHRIQGKVVVPLVFVVDWFAGMARALTPGCTSVQLRDVRVLRGVTLDPFEGPGVRFTLVATASVAGEMSLELRGPGGVVHYTATVAPAFAPVRAERLQTSELPASPWSRAEIYAPGVLFHGPDFHAIRELDGIAAGGARAALSRMEDLRWPRGAWTTDPALLDGALQVGVLCAQLAIGATLPLRIGQVGYALGAVRGPIRCGVVVRSQTPERMVFDVALEDPAGVTVAEIVDAEVYAVPSGTSAN